MAIQGLADVQTEESGGGFFKIHFLIYEQQREQQGEQIYPSTSRVKNQLN